MSEPADKGRPERPIPDLKAISREVKNAMADRDDVVVDLGDAERMRLEILLDDLQSLIAQVPAEDERFDFTISSGTRPRLWIDSVAHVSMGRDRRTYRLVADSRMGRVVLAENADMRPVAMQVARYVAERLLERDRSLGSPEYAAGAMFRAQSMREARLARLFEAIVFALLGALAASAVIFFLFSDRLSG
jgi:hypothetical protein